MTKTAIAEAASPAATFRTLPLELVDENPKNPRKHFDKAKMDELATSIREHGVLEPILVRPKGDRFQVVFGARRLRASRLAEQATIPAIVRELSDTEALEKTVIENLQRADVHPLEEAEGYEQLLESKEKAYTVDDIAAKVGKSRAYVYARMKLLALCKPAREAFYGDLLSPSVALLVARIPSAELQAKALKRLDARRGEDPVSFREAARIIHDEFMLKLEGAPFSPTDEKLVPAAGACTACPKRTGSQPELFADVASADVCSDPACYQSKVEAAWRVKAAEAKKAGQKVLPEAKAKKVFQDYGWQERPALSYDARGEFTELDAQCFEDPKSRTYRVLLGDHARNAVVLARDPKGNTRELLPAREVPALLKAAGHAFKTRSSSSSSSSSSRSSAERKPDPKRQLEDAVTAEVAARIAAAGEKKKPDSAFWRLLVGAAVEDGFSFSRRLGAKPGHYVEHSKRDKYVAKLGEAQLRGLVLELAFESDYSCGREQKSPAAAWAGVDWKKVEAEVKAKLEAAEAAAKPPAKKAAPKKTGTAAKLAKGAKKKGARRG